MRQTERFNYYNSSLTFLSPSRRILKRSMGLARSAETALFFLFVGFGPRAADVLVFFSGEGRRDLDDVAV